MNPITAKESTRAWIETKFKEQNKATSEQSMAGTSLSIDPASVLNPLSHLTLQTPQDDLRTPLNLDLYSTKTTNFEEDIDYEEYRILNLKRNLYGYNKSYKYK